MKIAVQVGTSDGKDDFCNLCKQEGFDLVHLIEPLKENNELISANYAGTIHFIHNVAVTSKSGVSEARLYDMSKNGQHDSLSNRRTHDLSEIIKAFSYRTVPCMTIDNFCELCGLKEIDLLCIDTEGLDNEIILSIAFDKIKIRRIIWEQWIHENDDRNGEYRTGPAVEKETIEKLSTLGYKVTKHGFGDWDESNWLAVKE